MADPGWYKPAGRRKDVKLEVKSVRFDPDRAAHGLTAGGKVAKEKQKEIDRFKKSLNVAAIKQQIQKAMRKAASKHGKQLGVTGTKILARVVKTRAERPQTMEMRKEPTLNDSASSPPEEPSFSHDNCLISLQLHQNVTNDSRDINSLFLHSAVDRSQLVEAHKGSERSHQEQEPAGPHGRKDGTGTQLHSVFDLRPPNAATVKSKTSNQKKRTHVMCTWSTHEQPVSGPNPASTPDDLQRYPNGKSMEPQLATNDRHVFTSVERYAAGDSRLQGEGRTTRPNESRLSDSLTKDNKFAESPKQLASGQGHANYTGFRDYQHCVPQSCVTLQEDINFTSIPFNMSKSLAKAFMQDRLHRSSRRAHPLRAHSLTLKPAVASSEEPGSPEPSSERAAAFTTLLNHTIQLALRQRGNMAATQDDFWEPSRQSIRNQFVSQNERSKLRNLLKSVNVPTVRNDINHDVA